MVVNEFMKSISEIKLPTFLFLFDLSLLNVKISRAYINEPDSFKTILIIIVFY